MSEVVGKVESSGEEDAVQAFEALRAEGAAAQSATVGELRRWWARPARAGTSGA